MSKIKNDGLYQYGAKPFEQQQFGTAGVERVNAPRVIIPHVAELLWCLLSPHTDKHAGDIFVYCFVLSFFVCLSANFCVTDTSGVG